jgi:hypothetical protein
VAILKTRQRFVEPSTATFFLRSAPPRPFLRLRSFPNHETIDDFPLWALDRAVSCREIAIFEAFEWLIRPSNPLIESRIRCWSLGQCADPAAPMGQTTLVWQGTGEMSQEVRKAGRLGHASPPQVLSLLRPCGFPEPLARSPARARQWHRQYLTTLIERDVRDIARVRDIPQLRRLLEILALQTGELLNVTALTNALDARRETVEHYLAILERLFLVRRLPAWHPHEAKRLIKSPKLHFVDSGLSCLLSGISADDWIEQRSRFGHVLESYVIQQVIAQAGWTDQDVRFWHYRDKDQVEIDLVLTRGKQIWGLEVKAASTVQPGDARGLMRLAELSGTNFQSGVVLYSGNNLIPLSGPKIIAAPLRLLWQL